MSTLVIPDSRIKPALTAGKLLIGTMVAEVRQPSIMQLLANAGFDYVIIDNEHGAFSVESIADLSRMARLLEITPIVRVPDLAYPYLAQSLDGGAQGIMLPRVTHADQVHAALEIMKYPPVGKRGCAMGRGHTAFRAGPVGENMAQANRASLLVVQVETVESVEQVDALAAIPGVDVLFVGPNDLSIALGVAGQQAAPVLEEAIGKVVAACRRHGVTPAIQANDLAFGTKWIERGMRMISYSSEIGLLVAAAKSGIETLRHVQTG
jgi:2-keto-3-deoxy-L-rhamnonate aldolase RhmA